MNHPQFQTKNKMANTFTTKSRRLGEILHDRHWHDRLGRGMNRSTTCRRVAVLIIVVCRCFLLDKLDTIRDGFAVVRVVWVVTWLYIGGSRTVVVRGLGQCRQHDQAEYSLPETFQQRHRRQAFVLTDIARVASEPGHA
jgi:hypothetical protein